MQNQNNPVTEKTILRLEALDAQQIKKDGKTQRIQSIQRNAFGVKIITDFSNINLDSEEKALNFLIDAKIVHDDVPKAASQQVALKPTKSQAYEAFGKTMIGNGTISSVAEILLDNIQRIQADKDFIPQAKAIQEQADSLIDIAKMEVDMFKSMLKKED